MGVDTGGHDPQHASSGLAWTTEYPLCVADVFVALPVQVDDGQSNTSRYRVARHIAAVTTRHDVPVRVRFCAWVQQSQCRTGDVRTTPHATTTVSFTRLFATTAGGAAARFRACVT